MKIWTIVLLLIFPLGLFAQGEKISWTEFSELPAKLREEPKPLLIFIHTDWCKFCKMQEKVTFKDAEIVQYLSENFYCLKLNGEEKESITFFNRDYHFISTGSGTGQHQLAEFLGKKQGVLSYPSTVVLSDKLALKGRESGFLDKKQLISLLSNSIL